MDDSNQKAKQWLQDTGADISFPFIKTLLSSDCTQEEFLVIVSQKLLLKQYSCFDADFNRGRSFLGSMETASKSFSTLTSNSDKSNISFAKSNKKLRKLIEDLTDGKYSKTKQVSDAKEFCDWYETSWFGILKSSDCYDFIESRFDECDITSKKLSDDVKGNWSMLSAVFSLCNTNDFNSSLEDTDIDTSFLTTEYSSLDGSVMSDSMESVLTFIDIISNDAKGLKNIAEFKKELSSLISSFFMATLKDISDIKRGEKETKGSYEPYSLFKIFKGTCLESLMILNQLTMSMYSFFREIKA